MPVLYRSKKQSYSLHKILWYQEQDGLIRTSQPFLLQLNMPPAPACLTCPLLTLKPLRNQQELTTTLPLPPHQTLDSRVPHTLMEVARVRKHSLWLRAEKDTTLQTSGETPLRKGALRDPHACTRGSPPGAAGRTSFGPGKVSCPSHCCMNVSCAAPGGSVHVCICPPFPKGSVRQLSTAAKATQREGVLMHRVRLL